MKPIRVLIADDSRSMRAILVALLREDPGIAVVGEAADGVEVVELAKSLKPDIITMDVKMPRMSGLEAIDAIMAEVPSRILVVCAIQDDSQVDLSFRAVAAGALELIAKPTIDAPAELEAWGVLLRESVRLMAEVPVVGRRRGASVPEGPGPRGGRIDALGIVASTGGPPALASILSQLPRDLPIPIFVAQHMTPGFGEGLCRWLNGVTQLKVLIPAPGVACRPGHVYLARDGHDLAVDREGLVRQSEGVHGHCPSANVLLGSLAAAYGSRDRKSVV
jgi:two-component system, chemotaxis family, protein-glutamate methylesterase/glutaminase